MSDVPEPPMVVRVSAVAPPKKPRPGFWEACLLTFAYWISLLGLMLAVIVVATVWLAVFGDKDDLKVKPGADPNDMASLPPALRGAIAWSFPAGYLGGLIFSLVVLRVVVGRGWTRAIGLRRLPPFHLMLGLLALPGFVVLSDVLAQFVQPIDALIQRLTGIGSVGDMNETLRVLLQDFHWSFAVFAIGVGPGLVEELWCRGFLGRGLIGRHGWFMGIALSSMFFGMLHLWPPSYVIVTAVMGACLHFAYVTSRSLWVPIAMHMMNNSFAALGSMKVIPTERMDAAMLVNPTPIIVAAVCVLLFCGLAMWHSRWTWPGETLGELIPPRGSGIALISTKPDVIYTVASCGFCAVLIWLLVG